MALRVKLKVGSIRNHQTGGLSTIWSWKRGFSTNTTTEWNNAPKQGQSENQPNSYVRPYPPNIRDISHKFEDDHPYKDVDFKTLSLDPSKIEQLANFVQTAKRLVVITGAGISVDSGIPDYRGPNGSYRKGHKPITHTEFIRNRHARQRYWVRNTEAWPAFSTVEPNTSHYILAKWENNNLTHIITQNVDRLHHKAGSRRVIELHGNSHHVACLGCGHMVPRAQFQQMIKDANPNWKFVNRTTKLEKEVLSRPDGDVEVSEETSFDSFHVPNCNNCGGLYKPTVVFFGDNVPKDVVANAMEAVKQADKLLVIGSSLMVYSSFRFAQSAFDNKIPLGILNMGPTRADSLASLKIELPCSRALEQVTLKEVAEEFPSSGEDEGEEEGETEELGDAEADTEMEGVLDGDNEIEGVLEGETEMEGVLDGETEMEGVMDGETEMEGEADALTEIEGVLDGETDTEGVMDGETEIEGVLDGETDTEGVLDGETEMEGVLDAETEMEGVLEGETDTEGVLEGETEMEGVLEGETDMEGVMDGLAELDGVMDGETEMEGVGDGLTDIEGVLEGVKEGEGDPCPDTKDSEIMKRHKVATVN